ncbi:hypothetical protein [Kaarinaea lacus]
MKLLSIIFSIFFVAISGCDRGGNSNLSPLVGVWITESCESHISNDGVSEETWRKGVYEFTARGELITGWETYGDSNCVEYLSTQIFNSSNSHVVYKDLGAQMLQEGIIGAGLSLQLVVLDQPTTAVYGYYAIIDNRVCFSERFVFEVSYLTMFSTNSDAIDFNSCLIQR